MTDTFVTCRCKQTGFTVDVPQAEYDAWGDDYKDFWDVLPSLHTDNALPAQQPVEAPAEPVEGQDEPEAPEAPSEPEGA